MKKFKKADRERFMSDWLKCLPAMRVERSMSLMKRNGPILVGVYLRENRGNDNYAVVPHIHSLLRPTDFITLTLAYPLMNRKNTYQEAFTVDSHNKGFLDACESLRRQTLFPLGESLSIEEVIHAYDTAIERNLVLDSREMLFEDILSLLSWCGRIAEAEKRYADYVRTMSDWDEWMFRREGGRLAFFDKLGQILEDPDRLRVIYEEQVKLLKVDKLPDYGFFCD